MAFTHGKDAALYIEDRNVTGSTGGGLSDCWFNEVSMEFEIDTADTSCIGAGNAKTYIPGMSDATLDLKGMFDRNAVDASSLDYKLNAMTGLNDQLACYLPSGDSTSVNEVPAFIFRGMIDDYTIETVSDDVATIELEFQSNVGHQRGVVLHGLAAETANWSSGGQVHTYASASSTTGWSAALHVTNITGTSTPGVTAKLQDSADNVTYADLSGGGFGAVTAVGGTYIVGSSAATVRKYVRVTWTVQGTTPNVSFFVAFNRGL